MWIGDNLLEMTNGQIDAFFMTDVQMERFLAQISQAAVVIQIVTIVIGLLVGFLGLKLIRVLSAISGLAVGAVIGTAAALGFHFSGTMIPVAILIGAVVLAVLSAGIRKIGVFLTVFLHTAGIVISFRVPGGLIFTPGLQILILLAVCAVVSLVMSVLAMIRTDPVVIIVTGISGGLSAGISAAAVFGFVENVWIGYGIGAVLALLGIWTQFMMQSRKIGKKEKVYARQMREQVSRESEVEKARKILEDDEEDDETDSKSVKSSKKVKADKKKKNKKKSAGKDSGSEDTEDDDITIINEEL